MIVNRKFAPVTITFNDEQEYRKFFNEIEDAYYLAGKSFPWRMHQDTDMMAYAQYLLKELK